MIGEAARQVSREFTAAHPEIPWENIVGMRHKVVHDYAGVLIGALVAAWAVRLVRALLYETDTADPVLFAASTAGLLLVAGVAAYLPARRASRVDPMVVLRTD